MKILIISNSVVLLVVAALIIMPVIGVILFGLVVYVSKHNRKAGMFWVRCYRQTLRLENKLIK